MYKYRRMLVALALSDLDESVLKYAAMMVPVVGVERVDFLHVVKDIDVSPKVRSEYPQVVESCVDTAERQVKEAVAKAFGALKGVETRIHVAEGASLKAILSAIKTHDIDLVVMGRKAEKHFGGTLSEKVARKAPCSVLIVPAGAVPRVEKILTPLDFSEQSCDALCVAAGIAGEKKGVPIVALHVYQVPIGYHRSGKTFEEFGEIMRLNAMIEYEECIEQCGVKEAMLQPAFVLDEHVAEAISRAVTHEKADLLVLGARGRTNSAAALLGSVTEKCLAAVHVPLLAVKPKGDNMSLLEALLRL